MRFGGDCTPESSSDKVIGSLGNVGQYSIHGSFQKYGFLPPKSSHFNRIFRYFQPPFSGTPILGNTHMAPFLGLDLLSFVYLLGFV